MKKTLAFALALVMSVVLVACGESESESSAKKNGDTEAEDVIVTIVNDGDDTCITSSAFDEYFDGNAAEGVEELLNSGSVYVNGIQVPATEDEMVDYQVNGVSSLYKTDSGWGYNVHKTTSADNLSFDDARMGFIETITTVRGHETILYGDSSTGLVNKIDTQSYDVVRVTEVVYYNESITVVRGDFELETDRVRPDVNQIIFHSSRFDNNIEVGDFALYYYGPDGWVINKADSIVGTLSKTDDDLFQIKEANGDEYTCIESNVSRYNLINCNRPSQFYSSYVALGMENVDVTMWLTPTGHPIGFTYGDKAAAKEALGIAIEHATADKDGVVVSDANGADVPVGTKWVTQADMDAYDEAIEKAQAAYDNNSTAVQEFDDAIYQLALALGESGENPSGFLGAQGEGTMT